MRNHSRQLARVVLIAWCVLCASGCRNDEPNPFAGKSPQPPERAKAQPPVDDASASAEESATNDDEPPRTSRAEPTRRGKPLSFWTSRLADPASDPAARIEAVAAIVEFGPEGKAAEPALTAVLLAEGDYTTLMEQCADALRAVGAADEAGKKLSERYLALSGEFGDSEAKSNLARSLAQLGAGGLPHLLQATRGGGFPSDPAGEEFRRFRPPQNDPGIEAAAEKLAAELVADPADFRIAAMLGRLGPRALPALRNLIEHDNSQVRAQALLALIPMGEKAAPALPWVYPALRDGNAAVRRHAAGVLEQIGPAALVAAADLEKLATDDESSDVRLSAAIALANVEPASAAGIPTLQEFAERGDERQREFAVEALGRLDASLGDRVVPLLAKAFRSPEDDVRRTALSALADRHGERAVEVFRAALASEDDEVAAAAGQGLSQMPELAKPAEPELLKALEHSAERVRLKAAVALLRGGQSQAAAMAVLTSMLDSSDHRQKIDAIVALGSLGESAVEAVPKLMEMLDDDRVVQIGFDLYHVGGYAATNLKRIDKELKQARPYLTIRLRSSELRERAARMLEELDEKLAEEIYTELLTDEDAGTRRFVEQKLKQIQQRPRT